MSACVGVGATLYNSVPLNVLTLCLPVYLPWSIVFDIQEKRRKEQAEYMELLVQYEQERRERQEKERIRRQEEMEKKRIEREKRQNAMNSFGFQLQFVEVSKLKTISIQGHTPLQ